MAKDTKQSIIFRIDRATKKELDTFCKTGFSQQHVLESLLKWFNSQSPNEKVHLIQEGSLSQNFGDTLERLQWANHAFSLKFWDWASEEYLRLLSEAREMQGVNRFSKYRVAYCAVELAMEERKKALHAKDEALFQKNWESCLKFLQYAIYFNRSANRDEAERYGQSHPIIQLNEGCSLSFQAQCTVESELTFDHPWIKALAQENDPTQGSVWEEEICHKWRREVDPITAKRVDKLAKGALTCLQALTPESAFEQTLADSVWLSITLHEDEDLRFLRCDPQIKDAFLKWVNEFTSHKPEETQIQRFEHLLEATSEADADFDNLL